MALASCPARQGQQRSLRKMCQVLSWALARVPALGGEPGCAVELTEVRARGEDWWSMGFEATGPADLLRGELEATAALVFAEALPGGVAFGTDDSRSYAEWLWRRPGGESGKP